MADGRVELSLGLLKTAPGTAASVLEQHPVKAVSDFLQEVPARLAAPVLARMLPFHGARCLAHLPEQTAVAFLREMPDAVAANLLRQWSPSQRNAVLDRLPGRQARALRAMLGYPLATVGAWMNAQPALLLLEHNAATALQSLREEAREVDRTIFVVDREQRLQGSVSISALLQAGTHAPLSHLLEVPGSSLIARADLAGQNDHRAWDTTDVLPVTRRDGRVVGVLRHTELRRGLLEIRAAVTAQPTDRLVQMAENYWLGLLRILEDMLGLIPTPTPTRPRKGRSPE